MNCQQHHKCKHCKHRKHKQSNTMFGNCLNNWIESIHCLFVLIKSVWCFVWVGSIIERFQIRRICVCMAVCVRETNATPKSKWSEIIIIITVKYFLGILKLCNYMVLSFFLVEFRAKMVIILYTKSKIIQVSQVSDVIFSFL